MRRQSVVVRGASSDKRVLGSPAADITGHCTPHHTTHYLPPQYTPTQYSLSSTHHHLISSHQQHGSEISTHWQLDKVLSQFSFSSLWDGNKTALRSKYQINKLSGGFVFFYQLSAAFLPPPRCYVCYNSLLVSTLMTS